MKFYLLYFLDRLRRSFPRSGTEVLLQSPRVRSSKEEVENFEEIGILDMMSSSGNVRGLVRGLLNPDDSLRPLDDDPNSL